MMFVEGVLRYLFPNTKLFHYERTIKIPVVGKIMLSPLRLVGRSIAVAITTVLVNLISHTRIETLENLIQCSTSE